MRLNKDEYEFVGEVMSNFDGLVNKEIEAELRQGKKYGNYPAWNFHGSVWFEDDKFHCEVKCYGSLREIISAETLEEIMSDASSSYGSD